MFPVALTELHHSALPRTGSCLLGVSLGDICQSAKRRENRKEKSYVLFWEGVFLLEIKHQSFLQHRGVLP